ncbi:unnamed protein product [Ectocarpus sp. CCAP 1310/34]|nr:unnamed protein product [Ectocarpus sp. CCAP 1310/34]
MSGVTLRTTAITSRTFLHLPTLTLLAITQPGLLFAEDERNKSTPWRPPGSPSSANVVATAVAATAAAAAAMARSARPTMNPHRNRISRSKGGPIRQGSVDRRGPPRDDEFSHAGGGWGDGRVGGEEGGSPVSVRGTYCEERSVGRS